MEHSRKNSIEPTRNSLVEKMSFSFDRLRSEEEWALRALIGFSWSCKCSARQLFSIETIGTLLRWILQRWKDWMLRGWWFESIYLIFRQRIRATRIFRWEMISKTSEILEGKQSVVSLHRSAFTFKFSQSVVILTVRVDYCVFRTIESYDSINTHAHTRR